MALSSPEVGSSPDSLVEKQQHYGRMVALLMASAFLCHFNRISITVAGDEYIIGERGVSATDLGWVYASYLLVYTVFMIPGGWLIDRIGPRAAMLIMGCGSAVVVALTGLPLLAAMPVGAMLAALIAVRSLLGVLSVPMHPGAARMVAQQMEPSIRPRAVGLVSCAALVGVSASYPLFGALADRFGWPLAFVFSGAATGAVAVLFGWLLRGPGYSSAMLRNGSRSACETIGRAVEQSSRSRSAPLRQLTRSRQSGERPVWMNRSLWLLTLSYAAVGYFQYLFFYWVKTYFRNLPGVDDEASRFYAMICTLAMAVGMALGGCFSEGLRRSARFRHRPAVVPVTGMLVGGVLTLLGTQSTSLLLAVILFSLSMIAIGCCEGICWTLAVELGGRRGGVSAGIFNTGANAGGTLAPVLTPYLVAPLGWKLGFGCSALVCVLGAVLWIWIDPNERTDATEPGDQDNPAADRTVLAQN